MSFNIDWTKPHIVKTNTDSECLEIEPEQKLWRSKIEPWLSAIFQSEHLSLLVGSGMTNALSNIAYIDAQTMGRLEVKGPYAQLIYSNADSAASAMERGKANLEDDFRVALELLRGYDILGYDKERDILKLELDERLKDFIKKILGTEREFKEKLNAENLDQRNLAIAAFSYLSSFLLSFSSRAASRERLNIFTTNYDRFLEFGCDEVGILLLDRFKGKIQPVFRTTKLELDYHYNPPGIRGEPRYVEGVSRITKLHGSIDWQFKEKGKIIRSLLPFGASENHPDIPENGVEQVVIYPNSSKDIETAYYPYSELFRDFSSAVCRPNSSIITYGYGFGDSHINRILADMFTIPSTHLVIIAYNDEGNRIQNFLEGKNKAQFTLLLGDHFGSLENLVDYYLPKSAIDRLTIKMNELIGRRDKTAFHTTVTPTPPENLPQTETL
jgi:hypothetical protein